MRTDFTQVREGMNVFLNAMEGALSNLLTKANDERKELLSLYARMAETKTDLIELTDIADGAAMVLGGIFEVGHDVVNKVVDAIDGGADCVPECSYEEFVDFCDECGRTIVNSDDYTVEAGGLVFCADCRSTDTDADNQ